MAADISNDARGWILCAISSIACVAGACIVCVDVFIRMLPGMKMFNIQDSSAFLSASLSLSFGVMIFSSLFSMLPSSKKYLINDGRTEQLAGLLMIVGFCAGFVGMQIVSRVIHRFMPSHVVDCDHTHEDEAEIDTHKSHTSGKVHNHSHGHTRHSHHPPTASTPLLANFDDDAASSYSTACPGVPSLTNIKDDNATVQANSGTAAARLCQNSESTANTALQNQRPTASLRHPSMIEVRNRVISFVQDVKSNCDEFGPCFGYTDPCGQECKRNFCSRPSAPIHNTFASSLRPSSSTPALIRNGSAGLPYPDRETSILTVPEENSTNSTNSTRKGSGSRSVSPTASGSVRRKLIPQDLRDKTTTSAGESSTDVSNTGDMNGSASVNDSELRIHDRSHPIGDHENHDHHPKMFCCAEQQQSTNFSARNDGAAEEDIEATAGASQGHSHASPHHHHVPANAFLSIGLQTVLAIGLHKLPEGFITFATNHANPALGFNVFLALFVHNIAEGFAMALPLYMALGSRLRAIAWAALLGGLSQPLGAGCAAIWLKYLAHRHASNGSRDGDSDDDPNTANGTAYGILFAITGGIMVAVALQLFVESLTIHHNRQLAIGFAFVGMMLLGLCNAIGTH
ncbi:Zinc transporter [Sporothrix epigloea]|uniref:Zinc transporter n=1 Tax=Sporothrix epigloea TaxID=1892477 RepID=A0ABP0DKN2_9PEZI